MENLDKTFLNGHAKAKFVSQLHSERMLSQHTMHIGMIESFLTLAKVRFHLGYNAKRNSGFHHRNAKPPSRTTIHN
jgi:hypothetical protein